MNASDDKVKDQARGTARAIETKAEEELEETLGKLKKLSKK